MLVEQSAYPGERVLRTRTGACDFNPHLGSTGAAYGGRAEGTSGLEAVVDEDYG
jgi:hypothetical protein